MLKRSPGSKISGMSSSTIRLPEGSFLTGLVAAYSYLSRKIDLTRGFMLCEEEGTLDGTPKNPMLGLKPLGSSRHSGSKYHLRIS